MRSPLFDRHGIAHGFGNLSSPVPETLREEWERLRPLHKQVHGTRVAWFDRAGEEAGECDALFAGSPGLLAGVVTADCVPILFARKDGTAIGAVHAGWRGMIARIVKSACEAIRARGDDPAHWIAAVGPAIGPCCFEVEEALAERFVSEFRGTADAKLLNPRFRHLDLAEAALAELRTGGISEAEALRICTKCAKNADGSFAFHSHRRSPGAGRQISLARARK